MRYCCPAALVAERCLWRISSRAAAQRAGGPAAAWRSSMRRRRAICSFWRLVCCSSMRARCAIVPCVESITLLNPVIAYLRVAGPGRESSHSGLALVHSPRVGRFCFLFAVFALLLSCFRIMASVLSPPSTPPILPPMPFTPPKAPSPAASDDSELIEDLSFDYIFDTDGNIVRTSTKGLSSNPNSKRESSSPTTPEDNSFLPGPPDPPKPPSRYPPSFCPQFTRDAPVFPEVKVTAPQMLRRNHSTGRRSPSRAPFNASRRSLHRPQLSRVTRRLFALCGLSLVASRWRTGRLTRTRVAQHTGALVVFLSSTSASRRKKRTLAVAMARAHSHSLLLLIIRTTLSMPQRHPHPDHPTQNYRVRRVSFSQFALG
ncbi:hypothetical protein B0H10DRAFT_1160835 [Mycena sp. CBHHK59/15]|nr:hypothetical protein B0H10DRAFT_1160835 [Mycena sp. CBHHK59/15]